MSEKFKVRDNNKPHFITSTVVGWINVFTRPNHKIAIIDAIKYCQKEMIVCLVWQEIMRKWIHY